jgi:hypothetical protein
MAQMEIDELRACRIDSLALSVRTLQPVVAPVNNRNDAIVTNY